MIRTLPRRHDAMPAPDKRPAEVDAALKEIRDAGNEVRNLCVTFVIFLLYVNVTIGGTTHEQFLRDSAVTLPLLSVELKVVSFFLLTPPLVFLLHLNLLVQHYLLSQQVFALAAMLSAEPSARRRAQLMRGLGHLPFVHWLAGAHHGHAIRILLGVIVLIALVVWPLVTLLWLQLAFLPYHKESYTWMQRAFVMADCAALIWLWPKILHPDDDARAWWQRAFRWSLKRTRASRAAARASTAPPHDLAPRVVGSPTVFSILVSLVLGWSLIVATVPDSDYEELILDLAPAFALTDCGDRQVLGLTCALHESGGGWFRPSRNLIVRERLLSAGKPDSAVENALLAEHLPGRDLLSKVVGLDLRDRDLRYADFSRSSFPRADFRGADLTGANLRESKLVEADFSPLVRDRQAAAGHADAAEASRGEKSGQTVLTFSDLTGASVIGARFKGARLHGTIFTNASMQGVDLRQAKLFGARLDCTKLDGANASQAELHAADLRRSRLHGIDFSSALLYGAVARLADLDGARLHAARIHGASLLGAALHGADFRNVEFRRLSEKEAKEILDRVNAELLSGSPRAATRPMPSNLQVRASPCDSSTDDGHAGGSTRTSLGSYLQQVLRTRSLQAVTLVGVRVSPLSPCTRDVSGFPEQCPYETPEASMQHLLDLSCRSSWVAAAMVDRAQSGESEIYPELWNVLQATDCANVREEIVRRRRLQGVL